MGLFALIAIVDGCWILINCLSFPAPSLFSQEKPTSLRVVLLRFRPAMWHTLMAGVSGGVPGNKLCVDITPFLVCHHDKPTPSF